MIEFRLIVVDRLRDFKLSVGDKGVIKDVMSERDRIVAQRIITGPPGAGASGNIDLGTF